MIANDRAMALDALRGFAIIMMVLSGQIAWGILPAWMYHCQEPPPECVFNPSVLGITWVDLVFPFFLFSMGAAFPLSLGRKLKKGASEWMLTARIAERGVKLAFFAIFIQHFYPWMLSDPQDMRAWILSLCAFGLLFPMFIRFNKLSELMNQLISLGAMIVGVVMMLNVTYANNKAFSLGDSNIIILVLANMAFFGGLLYVFSRGNKIIRIGVLPFIMAVLIGSKTDGSWNQWLMNASPARWLYNFMFLKYLFIIVPGIYAGDFLSKWMKARKEPDNKRYINGKWIWIVFGISLLLIVSNIVGLFSRYLVTNLLFTVVVLVLFGILLWKLKCDHNIELWRKLYKIGAYLLLLGLSFEAYEGGIRKDPSTFSYYFVTSGLASFALIAFSILCDIRRIGWIVKPLEMCGKNPMIAYVSGSMLVIPLLNVLGLYVYLDSLNFNAWVGFLRGIISTTLVVLITSLFTHLKIYWRT